MADIQDRAAQTSSASPSAPDSSPEASFQQGLALGRHWVQDAAVKVAAWAEENPGQMMLAGLGLGFVIGKLFFTPSRRGMDLDFDD